jgi:dienelactone hydrolase
MTQPQTCPGGPYIQVSPTDPTLDTPLQIRLFDTAPQAAITFRARTVDQHGDAWSSWAAFTVPDTGVLDLTQHAPFDGLYTGVDLMGLIWSMTRDTTHTDDYQPSQGILPPTPLLLTAQHGDRTVAAQCIDRLRLPPQVIRTEVQAQGLLGTMFTPSGSGTHPGVVLLGGSEGGLHEDDAALLAGHGYAVFALAYFGIEGVPPCLANIPVEYFGNALRFLADQEHVRGDRLAIMGGSFGGQAALLVASIFPEIRAVVSVAGSGVITQGIDGDISDGDFLHILDTEVPPWTWRGSPLPFTADPATPELRRQVDAHEPVAMRGSFEHGLRDADRVAAATIPVERIHGAVLLISAGDDHSWPCDTLSDIALHRLVTHQHPHEHRHIRYPAAGHGICVPPFRPTTDTVVPGPGVRLDLGGTPQDTAAAQQKAWVEILIFLNAHLRT